MSNVPWYLVAKVAGRGAMAVGRAVDARKEAQRQQFLASLTPAQREAFLEDERRRAQADADAAAQRIVADRYRRVAERGTTGIWRAPLRPGSYEWLRAVGATLAALPPAGTDARYRCHLSVSGLGFSRYDRLDFHVGVEDGRWIVDLCHEPCHGATAEPEGFSEPTASWFRPSLAWDLVVCDPSELARLEFLGDQYRPNDGPSSTDRTIRAYWERLPAAWAAHSHLRPPERAVAIGGVPWDCRVTTSAVWKPLGQPPVATEAWNNYRQWPVPMPGPLVEALLGRRDAPPGDAIGWSGPAQPAPAGSFCACGAVTTATQRFCSECGAALGRACTGCATPLPAAAKFCPNCGTATAAP